MKMLLLCYYFISAAFKMIEGSQAVLQKFVYMFGNVVCLGLAVYKCQTMGLLPTTASDWLAFIEPQRVSFMILLMLFYVKLCQVYVLNCKLKRNDMN